MKSSELAKGSGPKLLVASLIVIMISTTQAQDASTNNKFIANYKASQDSSNYLATAPSSLGAEYYNQNQNSYSSDTSSTQSGSYISSSTDSYSSTTTSITGGDSGEGKNMMTEIIVGVTVMAVGSVITVIAKFCCSKEKKKKKDKK